jgi:hypothetical protein
MESRTGMDCLMSAVVAKKSGVDMRAVMGWGEVGEWWRGKCRWKWRGEVLNVDV